MPRAIIYTRVSTDEQARRGYSLRDQYERLKSYCANSGIVVAAHFEEDYSAKTFQRPAWTALMEWVRKHRGGADRVLVVKWDRFSRNATDALTMIRTLGRVGLEVQAIEQPIDLDIPEQLMMLSIYVTAPEVENRRRSQNVKRGMRRAMREGRYVNVPPLGYRRVYGHDGKMMIEPVGDLVEPIRRAFQLAASTNWSLEEIRRQSGLEISKGQFHRMMKN